MKMNSQLSRELLKPALDMNTQRWRADLFDERLGARQLLREADIAWPHNHPLRMEDVALVIGIQPRAYGWF
jgi:hypothetical protein